MTGMAELIQGLMYQLKGTRGNHVKARKDDGNSEKLARWRGGLKISRQGQVKSLEESGKEQVGRLWKILAVPSWLQLLMSYVDWRKISLQQN